MLFYWLKWKPARSDIFLITASGLVWILCTLVVVIPTSECGPNDGLRRHAPDDDELHDEEIFRAVLTSLSEWQDRKQVKEIRSNDSHIRVKRDEEVVCYGELGCFRDEGPFDYLDMLPSPPEEVASRFLLFTRQNRQIPQIFSYFNFTSMYNSNFNASLPTKVIIHGFGSTCTRMWASEMRLAFLAIVDCNVLCIDWENGAAMPNYVRAAVNTRLVGKQVAMLIKWLNEHLGSVTEDYHLVGFSLGAHVAGFAGQELKNLSRITGLDPAGPLFESYDPKVRLDSDDALFVDVIHSNGDSLLMGGLGSWEPMGHVDFYPNGGRVQKGCSNLFLGAVRDFLWSASEGDGRSLCNHRRAYKFFTESVSPRCPFPAFACESYDKFLAGSCFNWDSKHCGNMGFYADRLPNPKKGLLYLITREDEPFCANQFRIKIESSPSSAPVTTYGSLETVLIGNDFINETFLVTQTVKDNMVAGSALSRIIVAHPAITDPVKVQLKYTAYQGWLYSGISRWSMERLILTNAYGKSMSFCSRGLMLPSGVTVTVTLSPGVCVPRFTGPGPVNGMPGPHPPLPPGVAFSPPPGEIPPHGPLFHGFKPNTTAITPEVTTGSGPSGTSEHDSNSSEIDLLLKPPAPVSMHEHPPPPTPTGPTGDQVGPTYHLHQGEVDWTEWHPVHKPAELGFMGQDYLDNSYHSPHNNLGVGGTPVEFYPPVGEHPQTEFESHEPSEAPIEETTLQLNETAPTIASNETDKDNENKTALSLERLGIRICHMRTEPGHNPNASEGGDNLRKLTCIDTHNLTDLALTEMAHLVDLNDNLMKASEGLIINNEVRASATHDPKLEGLHPAPGNEVLGSIPVPPQSFWTAIRHNNSDTDPVQYKGADPDVVLPPHLQYILTQLDSQGFGPRATDVPQGTYLKPGTNHIFPPRNVRQRRLFPYSRALKPRPVVLASRRQNRVFDINEVHLTNTRPLNGYPRPENNGRPSQPPEEHPKERLNLGRPESLPPVPLALIGPALPVTSGRSHPAMTHAMLAPIIYSDGKFFGRMLPGPVNMPLPNGQVNSRGPFNNGPKLSFQPPAAKRMINGQEYISSIVREPRLNLSQQPVFYHGPHQQAAPHFKRKRVHTMPPIQVDSLPPNPVIRHQPHGMQRWYPSDQLIAHVQRPHDQFSSPWVNNDETHVRTVMFADSTGFSPNADVNPNPSDQPSAHLDGTHETGQAMTDVTVKVLEGIEPIGPTAASELIISTQHDISVPQSTEENVSSVGIAAGTNSDTTTSSPHN